MNCNNPALPALPDNLQPDLIGQLLSFGRFVEENCRPGCRFDLNIWPNPVWQMIEARLSAALASFVAAPSGHDEMLMLQWYNSGILLKNAGQIMGFDLVPVPRYYDWPDNRKLTGRLAEVLSWLLVTHEHADHFDAELVGKCIALNRPVLMHDLAALSSHLTIGRMGDQDEFLSSISLIKAHHGCHVWRDRPDEVAVTAFEIEFDTNFRLVFCGDLDYTRGLTQVKPAPDALFIAWRNPSAIYENGHPRQQGTTFDAIGKVIDLLRPRRIILQHYCELDHVYRGFSSSYELAAELIHHLPVKTDIFFWGDTVRLQP